MRVGILTDFPSIALQSGPALHTRFLHNGLTRRLHDVTLLGPDTTDADSANGLRSHLFRGVPYPSHPKMKIIVPRPVRQLLTAPRMDIIHGQTNNHVIEWANWLRKMHRTAVVNTHIIHLPTHSHFILSDGLYQNSFVRDTARQWANNLELDFARMYNEGDGLVVQSRYMVDYWRDRGVRTPIWVVGRPIDPAKFSAQPGEDPFPRSFAVGKRLVSVSRHDREKNIEALIEAFDRHTAAHDPEVTLTLVGHGHDHDNLKRIASRCRHADRIHFPGEVEHARLVDWYAHADVFVYTSLSETFGNVVNEALWCGLPVVALDDRMGVAHQVVDQANGFLVTPDRVDSLEHYGRRCVALVNDRDARQRMGQSAATLARRMSHPDVVLDRFERIYEEAIRHAHDSVPEPLSERGTLAQRAALARHVAVWARWNYTLLAVGNTVGRLGLGRSEVHSNLELDRPVAAPRLPARSPAWAQAAE